MKKPDSLHLFPLNYQTDKKPNKHKNTQNLVELRVSDPIHVFHRNRVAGPKTNGPKVKEMIFSWALLGKYQVDSNDKDRS